MLKLLDDAIAASGFIPDVVFNAHVLNDQRFTRTIQGREVPFIVAGPGGYFGLHAMQKHPDGSNIKVPYTTPGADHTLESFCDDRHGFLRLVITRTFLTGEYYAVPAAPEDPRLPAHRLDAFTLDLASHRLTAVQTVESAVQKV